MSLFKKKKEIPDPLYYVLNEKLAEAKEMGKSYFYYALLEGEYDLARAWAVTNRVLFEASHKNGNTIVYKISGF